MYRSSGSFVLRIDRYSHEDRDDTAPSLSTTTTSPTSGAPLPSGPA